MEKFSNFIASTDTTLYDGAKGTSLGDKVAPGQSTDILNITNPEAVRRVTEQYYNAGAVIVQTNTFRANKFGLSEGFDVRDVNIRGAQIARSVVGTRAYVAGSIGPSGKYLVELGGNVINQEMKETLVGQVDGLVEGGVDLLHLETMGNLHEVRAILEIVKARAPRIPIMVTFSFKYTKRNEFRSEDGVRPTQLITLADERGLLAYGANCGVGHTKVERLVTELKTNHSNTLIVMKLNAGVPQLIEGETVYSATPQDMAKHALLMRDLGVRIVGACCGSTPQHIEAMANALA